MKLQRNGGKLSLMRRRTGVLLFVATVLVAGACGGGDNEQAQRVRTEPPSSTSTSTTTTTIAPTPPTTSAAAKVLGRRIQRVSSLPGQDEPPAPKPVKATAKGPTPTGRIIIPRIGLNHLTYEGIDLSVIDYGPSHWPGTAMPGQVGNTVFPGHRVTHSHPFLDIDLIQIGDEVTFTNSTGTYTYKVTQTLIVDDEDVWIADPTDTPTMTIFGCHPKHSAKQRYVVKGDLVKTVKPSAGGGSEESGFGDYTTAPDPSNSPVPEDTTTTTSRKFLGILG